MSGDRVILAVKYTPAGAPKAVRKAVAGFLRYVQYRDQHADAGADEDRPASVDGLLKYVAFRDRARNEGRLFGPEGPAGDVERREFATYVAESVSSTRARRGPDGIDRRRAVYRFVISPERAAGLDLKELTLAAVGRLQKESKTSDLRWIAAEHRNTAHPHVHLVLAGMRTNQRGGFSQLLLTKGRLAAMKEELALEISRQRDAAGREDRFRRGAGRRESLTPARRLRRGHRRPSPLFIELQAIAARYRHWLEREMEEDLRRRERERRLGWSR